MLKLVFYFLHEAVINISIDTFHVCFIFIVLINRKIVEIIIQYLFVLLFTVTEVELEEREEQISGT